MKQQIDDRAVSAVSTQITKTTLSMAYKGMVYKGGFWAVLKILGKLRVPSTQAFQLRVFQRVGNS